MKNYYTDLSEKILSLTQSDQDTVSLRKQLFYIRQSRLEQDLNTDDLKKTFWINIYQAFYLSTVKENRMDDLVFKQRRIKIAHDVISLNDIEHGILRKSKLSIGFGYLSNPFYSSFIKNSAVQTLDYRIHFALRSLTLGKNSFTSFDHREIENQLTAVTKNFIDSETELDHESKTIRIADFILSYSKDFGGTTAIKKLLETIFDRNLQEYTLQLKAIKRIQKVFEI